MGRVVKRKVEFGPQALWRRPVVGVARTVASRSVDIRNSHMPVGLLLQTMFVACHTDNCSSAGPALARHHRANMQMSVWFPSLERTVNM